ncbi:MAG TPA: chalcone isomerase family protein [Cellvibrio sp.]|nr:chalcone isomerase family protein [Cellvibrio sp.]
MRRKILIFLSLFFIQTNSVFANEKILAAVPDAAIVGSGVLSYAFWDIYQATLYAPQGHWNSAQPFSLSITYYRAIKGTDIADRSVQEMRKQGFLDEVKLAAWHAQMKSIFPNVNHGTVLSAVFMPEKHTIFYKGTDTIGSIKGDDFGQLFFGIWLDPKTSEPKLRRELLGLQ